MITHRGFRGWALNWPLMVQRTASFHMVKKTAVNLPGVCTTTIEVINKTLKQFRTEDSTFSLINDISVNLHISECILARIASNTCSNTCGKVSITRKSMTRFVESFLLLNFFQLRARNVFCRPKLSGKWCVIWFLIRNIYHFVGLFWLEL